MGWILAILSAMDPAFQAQGITKMTNLLHTGFADLKSIDGAGLRPIFADANPAPMIDAGWRLVAKVHRRRFTTVRNSSRAAKQIGRLPKPDQVLHMLLAPNAFSCFDVLPAILEMKAKPAREVLLMSLGINERHLQNLDELAEAGLVRNVRLVLSHYFRGVDPEVYQLATSIFAKHNFKLAAVRSHVKVIAIRFDDGCFVAAGSGNLRSCRACEQMDLHNSRRLFRFYSRFADEMLSTKLR